MKFKNILEGFHILNNTPNQKKNLNANLKRLITYSS